MSPARSRKRYFISYTALFAVILTAVSSWLLLTGRSLVLGGDPVAQHVRALIYYSRWLRELPGYLLREHRFPAYSLSIGYGSDVITTLHFYVVGDPLNLLCAFVPTKYISVFYTVMIVVRMYLMGLSFSYMCFVLRKTSETARCGGSGKHSGFSGLENGIKAGIDGRSDMQETTGRSVSAGRSDRVDIPGKAHKRRMADKSGAAGVPGMTGILAGTLTYVFSAYTIFGGWRHPFFLNPLIYMPLIIAGAEKIRTQKKHLLFALAVAVSAMSNFYFFYMIVLVTVVYVVWKCVCAYGKDLKKWLAWIGHLSAAAVTGVLTAGVILLPVLSAFAGNPRSVKGYIFDGLYAADYYLKFPASLITFWSAGEWGYVGLSSISLLAVLALFATRQAGSTDRHQQAGSPDGCGQAGNPDGCLHKDPGLFGSSCRRKGLLVLFLLGTAALLIPAVGYGMNGFSYVSNRWVWAYVLLCAYLTTEGWRELEVLAWTGRLKRSGSRIQKEEKEGKSGFYIGAFLIIAVLLILSFSPVYEQIRLNLWIQLGLMGVGLLILWQGGKNNSGQKKLSKSPDRNHNKDGFGLAEPASEAGGRKKGKYPVCMAAVFSLMVLGICCNGLFGIIPALGGVGNGYYAWSRVAGENAEIFQTESAAIRALEGTDGFYRYSGKDLSGNASVQDGAPSTQFYWSLANGYVSEFLDKLGLCSSYVVAFANLDDRTILNEVAGVRDFYAQEEAHVPYGYDLLDVTQNPLSDAFPIYRNRYALPLGITYDALISETEFDTLDPGARQEVLLSRAVVPDEDIPGLNMQTGSETDIAAGKPDNGSEPDTVHPENGEKEDTADQADQSEKTEETAKTDETKKTGLALSTLTRQIPSFTAEPLKGKALIEGNTITVLEEDAKIRFRFEGTENSESYLYLGDMDYLPESGSLYDLPERLKIQVKAFAGKEKKMTRTLSWFTRKEKWYAGRNSFMFSGGYHEKKLTSFVLTLPAKGVYTFSEIAVYTQLFGETYVQQAAALAEDAPDQVDLHTSRNTLTWATGRVDAHVELSSPKLLCMQMAYSKGWKAFVDGQEVPVIRTDLMFTGVALDAGEHDIMFRYTTPGLLPGFIMTILGILIMICYGVRVKRGDGSSVPKLHHTSAL